MMDKKFIIKNIMYLFIITAILIIIFFIISYDGSYYDSIKAYSIFKDSMGLSIAILTPFVAIQIYNGWTLQHKAISNEKLTVNYYEKIKNLMYICNVNPHIMTEEKLNETISNTADSILFVKYLSEQLYGHDIESKELIENLKKLYQNLCDFQSNLYDAFNAKAESNYHELSTKVFEKHTKIHNFSNRYTPLKIK